MRVFNLRNRRRSKRNVGQIAVERFEDRTLLSSVIQVDNGFGTNGQLNVPAAVDGVVQNSGRVLITRPQGIGGGNDTVVIQAFNSQGVLDSTYGTNGIVSGLTPTTSVDATPLFLVLRPNDGGAIVVGRTRLNGETGQRFFLAAVDSAGNSVNTFGFQGTTTLLATDQDAIVDAIADNAGRLLLVRQSSTTGYYVQRFGANGLPDGSFGPQGKRFMLSSSLIPTDIAVQADNTVLVPTTFGSFSSTVFVMSFNGTNGTVGFPFSLPLAEASAVDARIAIDSSGQIYLAAKSQTETFIDFNNTYITSTVQIQRFSSTYLRDTGYAYSQNTSTTQNGTSIELGDLAVQANGQVLMSLNNKSLQPRQEQPTILRLKGDATPDVTFDDDGFFSPVLPSRANGDLQLLPMVNGQLLTLTPLAALNTSTPGSLLFSRYFVGSTPPTGQAEDIYLFNPDTGILNVQRSLGNTFQQQTVANWGADPNWDTVVGDFDGDQKLDFAGRNSAGRWMVYLAGRKQTQDWGNWNNAVTWSRVTVADFNSDGRDDILGQLPGGHWWVALSNGIRFVNEFFGRWQANGWIDFEYGDFTGDGKADVLGLLDNGSWILGVSTGTHFNARFRGKWAAAPAWQEIVSGDFDGDGTMEIAGRTTGGQWWLGEFGTNLRVQTSFMNTWANADPNTPVLTGDFNGDGRTDLLGAATNSGWLMTQGNGSTYQTVDYFGIVPLAGGNTSVVGDFNGDGRDDVASFNFSTGRFFTSMSTGTFFQQSLQSVISGFDADFSLGAGEIIP
ncbi:MAG: FG-GAP repeat protein [Planctomycetaceae bacterium]|nr:FG-GAP repeat protein [Planctomycetaceae bacterium]